MRRGIGLMALALVWAATLAFAQDATDQKGMTQGGDKVTMTGYVVDAMCAKGMANKDNPMDKAAAHTKECALQEGCSASGFGVFSDGKYYKFDGKGDEMAKDLIQKSDKEKGIAVEVSGTTSGDQFAVATMKEIATPESTQGGKSDVDQGAVKDTTH